MESRQAEQSVIGGCLLQNDAYWRIAGILVPDDFTDGFLRRCWSLIVQAASAGDAFDPVTLHENHGLDFADLLFLSNETPGTANIETYARIVRDRSVMRAAAAAASAAAGKLSAGDMDAIAELQMGLESLQRTDRPSTTFHEALQVGLDGMEAAREAAQSHDGLIGAPSGIPLFDKRTRGLSGGKLVILAARPSLGKTAFALQMLLASAKAGYPVGFLSLEMGNDEISTRSIAHEYQLNNTALAGGDDGALEAMARRFEADDERHHQFKTLPIYIDDDNFSAGGICGRISEWHRKYGIKLAVIDHLQLIELPEGQNRNDGLGIITRQLKILAKRLDIPIVLLCQLNRAVERENRRPRLSDLRDSGNIEQDADIVVMLHGDVEPDGQGMRDVELGFTKLRGGVVGWCGTMRFNGPTQTFTRRMPHEY